MNKQSPFNRSDLDSLEELLAPAGAVVSAGQAFDTGWPDGHVLMRHDIDHDLHQAVRFAEWEHERGYGSTYYLLHSAPYWHDPEGLKRGVDRLLELGREIGFHNDALADALIYGGDPHDIVARRVAELRELAPVRSTVAHGNGICHTAHFVNDEIFTECRRAAYGPADRTVTHQGRTVTIEPRPLAAHGFEFDPLWQPRDRYLSDSGGRWYGDPNEPAETTGQLMILIHPIWWLEAFS